MLFRSPKGKDYIGVLRLTASSVANCYKFSLDEIEDIKISIAEAAILYIGSDVEEDLTTSFDFIDGELTIEMTISQPSDDSLSLQIITALMDEARFVDDILLMKKCLKENANG